MKIRVSVTLDVNVDAWADEYGVEKSQVREDVQEYCKHTLHALLDGNGLLS